MWVRTTVTPERDLSGRSGGRSWRVTGGRPLFTVDESPASGWYLVHVDVDLETDATLEDGPPPMALRFLPASGSVPLARRPVPDIRGQRTRIVHVPEGTQRTALEISPWVDTVVARSISFRRLPLAVAASMMSADVAASAALGSTDRAAVVDDLRSAQDADGLRGSVAQIAVSYEHLQHRRAGDSVDYPSWRVRHGVVFGR